MSTYVINTPDFLKSPLAADGEITREEALEIVKSLEPKTKKEYIQEARSEGKRRKDGRAEYKAHVAEYEKYKTMVDNLDWGQGSLLVPGYKAISVCAIPRPTGGYDMERCSKNASGQLFGGQVVDAMECRVERPTGGYDYPVYTLPKIGQITEESDMTKAQMEGRLVQLHAALFSDDRYPDDILWTSSFCFSMSEQKEIEALKVK